MSPLALTRRRRRPSRRAGYLCESCRLHPAEHTVIVDGASFLVCGGCREVAS